MNLDRFKLALFRMVRRALWKLDYLALYAAKVDSQDDDLTLQVTPDDTRLPGMTGVPIRTFAPGVTIKITEGARVLIGFENGDPRRPYASLWEGAASKLSEIEIHQSDGVKITIRDSKLYLGGTDSTQPCPLGTDLKSWLTDSVKTQFNQFLQDYGTHTHSNGNNGAPTGAPIVPSTATSLGDPPDNSETVEIAP